MTESVRYQRKKAYLQGRRGEGGRILIIQVEALTRRMGGEKPAVFGGL